MDTGFAIAGVAVSAAGWITAIWQIVRIGARTKAIEDALEAERTQTTRLTLVAEVVRLAHLAAALARAVAENSRDDAIAAVGDWQTAAIRVRRVIDAAKVDAGDSLEALALALGLVEFCLTDLRDNNISVDDACVRLQDKIVIADGHLGGLMLTIRGS